MLRSGNSPDTRILETMPNCWFCGEKTYPQTREHIFSKVIQSHFEDSELHFNPTTFASRYGYKAHHELGPFKGNNLVAKKVCSKCNSGWMSKLEPIAAENLVATKPEYLDSSTSTLLANWFMKTAALLNVSQPTILCWPQQDRKRLITEPTLNASVLLFRTTDFNLNWLQGGPFLSSYQSEFCQDCMLKFLALTHQIAIHVGEYIGLVIFIPWQISNTEIQSDGTPLWVKGDPFEGKLDVPFVKDIYSPNLSLELLPNPFYQFSKQDECIVHNSSP